MKAFSRRPVPAMILVVFLGAVSIPSLLATTASPARDGKAVPPAVHTWELAAGGKVEASIVGYSLHSRIISLRHPDGRTAHIAPRDLTAMSKLKWLSSPAFIDAVKGYHPPPDAPATVAKALLLPALAGLLGTFLVFWIAVSMVSGQKRLSRAAATFGKCLLYVLVLATIAATMLHAVSVGLGSSPVAPMIHSGVVVVSLFAVVTMISSRIANDYAISGGAGFGSVMLGLVLGLIIATSILYGLPRTLQQPGIDDWFTDRLLAPLGLA